MALVFALHAGKAVAQIAAVEIILLRGRANVATPARCTPTSQHPKRPCLSPSSKLMGQVRRRNRHFGPVGSSVCGREDRVGVFDAHRRPDRREIV